MAEGLAGIATIEPPGRHLQRRHGGAGGDDAARCPQPVRPHRRQRLRPAPPGAAGGAALPCWHSPAGACPGRQGPGVKPVRGRSRLRQPPHHRADRQRRHAVPGRFDCQRIQPPRDRRPSSGPPVVAVHRDIDGDLVGFAADSGASGPFQQSLMHIEIDRQNDPALLDELAAALTRVLAEVRLAVEDWQSPACLRRCHRRSRREPLPAARQYADFLLAGSRPTTSRSWVIAATATSTIRRRSRACASTSLQARRSASCGERRGPLVPRPAWAAARR